MAREWESLNPKAELACMHRDGHNIAECAAGTSGHTSEWYITEGRSQLFTNSDVGTCQYRTVRLQHPAGNGDLWP